ncbi:MAG: major capsid protein [Rubrivivax sp.]|nr:major capsid protein [Rubrivivax sp.]MDP3614327.1 major capsid protein [Rubrivivax sp.]
MLKARLALVPAAVLGFASQVQAAVPADVTTAITDMKADGLTVATAVLVAIIAVMAIKFIRKGM